MSSKVIFSLTAPQCDYLRVLSMGGAAGAGWLTFNYRIGLALAKAGMVTFKGRRPYLTRTGQAAARLAHLITGLAHIPGGPAAAAVAREEKRSSDSSLCGSAVTSV